MAYFNHAFCKTFWGGTPGAGYDPTAGGLVDFVPGGAKDVGSFAFVNQASFNAAIPWPTVPVAPTGGEPLTLVATSLYQNDRVGPYHGGYQETSKSKMINPRFINRFYSVAAAPALTHIIGVGATPNLDISNGGADEGCCPEFFCNETYEMRFDLKGSPALRFLNHNAYEVAAAFTGCCDGAVPELVDPAEVMSTWMQYIVDDPIFSGTSTSGFTPQTQNRLVNTGVAVTCDEGVNWDLYLPNNPNATTAGVYFEADGTTLTGGPNGGVAFVANQEAAVGGGFSYNTVTQINTYDSTFDPLAPNCCAGLILESAFIETRFGDCTFMPTDHFEVEPLLIQASMLDETGDPCVFDQLCISDGITPSGADSNTVYPAIQFGTQAMGTGESVLRDVILSEGYDQNPFHNGSDLRIREITQGTDVLAAVDRTILYDCYYILHSVPRPYNPSSTMDADQYLLKIPVPAGYVGGGGGAFETFMAAWLAGANNPVVLENF